jgi:hypothetical protein
VFADGQEFDVTPQVPAAYSYFTVLATQHKLVVECLSDYPTNKTRTTVGVAEDVSLAFQPPVAMGPGEQPWWLAFDGGVSSAFGSSTVFTAPSNAATAVVRVLVRAAQLDTTFRVLEPTGIRTSLGSPQVFDVGHVGVGMELNVFIEPVNVSFCKLHVMEIGEDATNVWGYFTNSYFTTSGLSHKNDGADVPHYVGSTNMIHEYGIDMFDWPRFDLSVPPAPPCTKGGYSWSIPAVWWVGDFFKSNSLPGWPGQNFELDDSGTATVEKFGWVATRATNERPSSARKQIQ